ncbi:hypothetical protein F4778DRAFT_771244 [Xylariomycetidae sp. FL2044]|nr:hypothetical protein F4778DRAFT_771244 [Xylariomycetidae sp. FL2044]
MEGQEQNNTVPGQQPTETVASSAGHTQQDSTNPSAQQPVAPASVLPAEPQQQQFPDNGLVFPNQDTTFAPLQQSNGAFAIRNMMMPMNPQVSAPDGTANTQPANAQPANGNSVSAGNCSDEIALYDRQIRLWGMQAQQKIQNANILLITMKALANEVAKNLVLAGIGSLTIIDDQRVTEADMGAQFFVSEENIGQNRAEAAAVQIQKMNPRVKVYPDSGSIMTKGASYFAAYDIVIATDLNPTLLAFINTATRLHARQFYAAGTHGLYGYIFCDLIEHDYVLTRDKGNVITEVKPESRTRSVTEVKTQKEGGKTVEKVGKRELYSTWDLASETSVLPAEYLKSKRRLRAVTPVLSCLRALWAFQQLHDRNPGHNKQDLESFTRSATHNHQLLSLPAETLRSEFLRSFLQNIGSEIAPVTAILGGQLAQDVINVLGQNQQPIQNMVVFDGNKMEANVYPMHPEGKLGRAQLELANPIPMAQPMGQIDPTQMVAMGQPQMMPGNGM